MTDKLRECLYIFEGYGLKEVDVTVRQIRIFRTLS
jgi:hypothetical protein